MCAFLCISYGLSYDKKHLLQENTGQTRGPSGLDLNVEPVWMQGITGRGVVVAFVDDGNNSQSSCIIIIVVSNVLHNYNTTYIP